MGTEELKRIRAELVEIHNRLQALQQSIDQNWNGSIADHLWNRIFEAKRHIEAAVFDEINPMLRDKTDTVN